MLQQYRESDNEFNWITRFTSKKQRNHGGCASIEKMVLKLEALLGGRAANKIEETSPPRSLLCSAYDLAVGTMHTLMNLTITIQNTIEQTAALAWKSLLRY
jgi:hypothetical protein